MPNDDYIKRSDAMPAVAAWYMDVLHGENVFLDKTINDIPAADVEPNRKWIPVTERLPNDIYPVNIVWVNREPEAYYSDIKNKPFTATGVYFAGHWYWYSATIEDILNEYGDIPDLRVDSAIEITHWAEIPEPPKEADDAT